MTPSNDNEEPATLRYFIECYWNQMAVDGDLRATSEVLASQEKSSIVRALLADLEEVGARGLFLARWPRVAQPMTSGRTWEPGS